MAAGNLHRWLEAWKHLLRPLLGRGDRERIARAIGEVERHTTGEVHVHLLHLAPKGDLLEEAKRLFHRLGMHETKHRNTVLILLSPSDRRFAIYGDEGMHLKAGQALWDAAKEKLAGHFKAGRYVEGVEACVRDVGAELARHFPKGEGPGADEVSNEVTDS